MFSTKSFSVVRTNGGVGVTDVDDHSHILNTRK